jgi:glycosyltransferase involved in cell wall biosynthesis
MEYSIQPTLSVILPVQNKQSLIIEQINNCFKFSELYPGFCEIIIVTDDFEDRRVYLLWLAMKLNKISHPHVRTKIIRYTSKLGVKELIETGLKHATGEKIVVAFNDSENVEEFSHDKIRNRLQNHILMVPHFLDIDALKEVLLK